MIGEQLGAYRIVREIGRGGMGSVWLGEHTELGHRVAIKVLLPQIVREPETVQRFFNEARAAARVRSPGIVQIMDFGRAADGAPYLAMELLEGQTLRARLREKGRLSVEEAATIGRQVATTLAAAHEAGIVHRDLKPDNIMMVEDPEVASGDRPKILDFGIAKLAEEHWSSSVQTRTGSLLGTPHYMSPEQCRGTGDIDPRTDVYALGCILFELVCGRPPFVSQGVGEIVGMHQFVPAPSPTSLRPDIPAWFETVILRALAKEPAARFASMDELAAALEAGGAPAARTGRGSGDYTADAPGSGGSIALQETMATPSALAETAVSEAVEGDPSDMAAMAATAQKRATEIAEQIAREHQASTPSKGGRRMTVIAVAVVILASFALVVHFKGQTAEPHAPRGDVAASKPDDKGSMGEPADHQVHQDTGNGNGSGHGGGSGSGTDTGSAKPGWISLPVDAGGVASVPRDAGVPDAHHHHHVPPADAGTEEEKEALYLQLLDELDGQFAKHDYRGALRNAQKAMSIYPDEAEPYGPAAIACCHLGKAPAARRYYRRVTDDEVRGIVRDRCAESGIVLPE